jgi:hypothetical protein
MTPAKAKARRILADAVMQRVLPRLHEAGFTELPLKKETIPMWDLHRPRKCGGYDAIDIVFDKKWRPKFYGMINTIEPEGIHPPWGGFFEASLASAAASPKRVIILKKRRGFLAIILKTWFSHGSFGFRPKDNPEANRLAALRTCDEFISCLDQAERWWANRELGPNLIYSDISGAFQKKDRLDAGPG